MQVFEFECKCEWKCRYKKMHRSNNNGKNRTVQNEKKLKWMQLPTDDNGIASNCSCHPLCCLGCWCGRMKNSGGCWRIQMIKGCFFLFFFLLPKQNRRTNYSLASTFNIGFRHEMWCLLSLGRIVIILMDYGCWIEPIFICTHILFINLNWLYEPPDKLWNRILQLARPTLNLLSNQINSKQCLECEKKKWIENRNEMGQYWMFSFRSWFGNICI